MGSGVVVHSEGYILTSNHVLLDGSRVRVVLGSQRESEAAVLAQDETTDVALLKVEEGELPFVPLGDSDEVRVGDWIFSVGNLYGGFLNHTLSLGIVSAKGRSNLQLLRHEEFIQTDAVIGPGASGGGIVNTDGELIAISTGAMNANGAWTGLGIAVPINLARRMVEQVMSTGTYTRGFIGADFQDLTPRLAESLLLKSERGALVSWVETAGAADAAGLQRGDVVLAFAGEQVHGARELRLVIAGSMPDSEHRVRFFRGGRVQGARLRVAEAPSSKTVARHEAATSSDPAAGLGLRLQTLTPSLSAELGYDFVSGVLIYDIVPWGPSHRSGLVPGDVIWEVEGRRVNALRDWDYLVAARSGAGKPLLLFVRGRVRNKYIALEMR